MVPGRFPHSQLRLLLDWYLLSPPLLFFFTNTRASSFTFVSFFPLRAKIPRGLPAGPVSFSDNLSFLLFVYEAGSSVYLDTFPRICVI